MNKLKHSILIASLSMAPLTAAAYVTSVMSPSGDVSVDFSIREGGRPEYKVNYKTRPVVLASGLGLELADGPSLMSDFEIIGTDTLSYDETWQPVWGENSHIRNNYRELLAHLRQRDTDRLMDIRFRVYDDGDTVVSKDCFLKSACLFFLVKAAA